MSKSRSKTWPTFKERPELKETRDEILYIGLKSPNRLQDAISQLSKESQTVIYEHAILGRHFDYIGRDLYYRPETIVRQWQRAVAEYHEKYKEG